MAALKYWVWLTALPGLSNRSRLLLLERYGSPEDVYYADAEELALTEGLTPGQAQLLSDKSLTRADRILADCARGDIFLLTMQDAVDFSCTALNGTARVVDGKVTGITRVYIP